MRSHLNLKIFGWVQGVSFRYYARLKAEELGVAGFVRNEPEGTVYLEAEGEKEALDKFLNWCRQGSPAAKVEKVKTSTGPLKGYRDFTTQR